MLHSIGRPVRDLVMSGESLHQFVVVDQPLDYCRVGEAGKSGFRFEHLFELLEGFGFFIEQIDVNTLLCFGWGRAGHFFSPLGNLVVPTIPYNHDAH